jgi:Fe-S cluster biogenesis protein NfuA
MTPTELRDYVQHVLRTEAAPSIGLDPSDVEVVSVADGIATIRLGPGCAGCGGVAAVVGLLEHELRQRIPDVEMISVTSGG